MANKLLEKGSDYAKKFAAAGGAKTALNKAAKGAVKNK